MDLHKIDQSKLQKKLKYTVFGFSSEDLVDFCMSALNEKFKLDQRERFFYSPKVLVRLNRLGNENLCVWFIVIISFLLTCLPPLDLMSRNNQQPACGNQRLTIKHCLQDCLP